MAEGDDYAKRTARIKNLLSSYYGDAPGTPPGAAAASAAPDRAAPGSPAAPAAAARGRAGAGAALSMDSPAFNADYHIQQMLRGFSLNKLLAEHRGMAREIKNLDSDMQQLVYENYNKFITATDTIKAMKSNVDSMEGDMDKLKGIMDDVADKSASVNSKLQRRRQHCEELRRVGDVLTKLQAVFDLPRRMRAALEEGALDSAVDFYADAQPLLRKYGHRGALRAVAAEAEAAAREVGAVLKRRLAERRDDAERAVLLLRRLGEGDESLQDKYLQGRAERMRRILSEASATADAMAAAAAARPGAPPPPPAPLAGAAGAAAREAWGFGADGAPPALVPFVRALGERLMSALQETVVNVSSIFLQDDCSAARRKPLVKVAKDVVGDYFKIVRRAVDEHSRAAAAAAARLREAEAEGGFDPEGDALKFSTEWGADAVAQAMEAVTADATQLAPQLPELGLRDWAAAAAEQALRGHVTAAFCALEERVGLAMAALARLGGGGSGGGANDAAAPLAAAFTCTSEAVQRCTMAMLQGLRTYQQKHSALVAPVLPQLGDIVGGQTQAVLMGLVANAMAMARVKDDTVSLLRDGGGTAGTAGTPAASGAAGLRSGEAGAAAAGAAAGALSDAPKTGLLLLLAKLCLFAESTTVPAAMEELAMNFPPQSADPNEPPPFVAGEVGRRAGTAAQLLLAAYVEAHGRALAVAVERSTAATNWLQASEPRAPRPVCEVLLERMGRAEAEVSKLVEATGRSAADALRGAHHRAPGSSLSDRDPGFALGSVAVERGVAKLFRSKAKITASVHKFTQAALLAAIAASGLKSLVECVRLQTLGRAGLQQLQLDMHYLRPRLVALAGGAEAVAQLIDEVVAAGAERSAEPGQLLEPAALERILAAAGESG